MQCHDIVNNYLEYGCRGIQAVLAIMQKKLQATYPVNTCFVFIDYENVQPDDLARLQNTRCQVIVFIGNQQNSVKANLAIPMQLLGSRGKYIKVTNTGKNVLDFYIASYLGLFSNQAPLAQFYIITKDSGFDSLINHFRQQKIQVRRFSSICDIPLRKEKRGESLSQSITGLVKAKIASYEEKQEFAMQVKQVITYLKKYRYTRPKSVKALENTFTTLFNKQLSSGATLAIIAELKKIKVISLEGEKINYNFQVEAIKEKEPTPEAKLPHDTVTLWETHKDVLEKWKPTSIQ